jgi:hypothetical protein
MSMLMNHLTNCTVEFSMDFNFSIEDFLIIDINGNEIKSSFEVVEDYIKKLFEENDLPISEHRTKGVVHIGEHDENTTVEIRYYNEPEDGSFIDYDFVIEGWCPLVNNYTV